MTLNLQKYTKNADLAHKLFTKMMSSTGFALDLNQSMKHLSFIHYIKSNYKNFRRYLEPPQSAQAFVRRNDTLFESKLLNEKVAYYCYLNKLMHTRKDLQTNTRSCSSLNSDLSSYNVLSSRSWAAFCSQTGEKSGVNKISSRTVSGCHPRVHRLICAY